MKNIVIFGAPGCGKGTQSERLIDRYGLHHISTGEVLRDEIARGTELGRLADSYISKGNLIPDDLMIQILSEILDKPEVREHGVIFDGFPRTVRQAQELEGILHHRGRKVDAVLGLEVPDEELVDRLVKRGVESGRADDTPETIQSRLDVYHNLTQPLRDYYKQQGKYYSIDGAKAIEDITDEIIDVVDRL